MLSLQVLAFWPRLIVRTAGNGPARESGDGQMAKVAMDLDARKAAFAARGGKIVTVESGVRAIESDRTIYAAMRNGTRASADAVREVRASESRHETMVGAFHAAKAMGWSNEAALEYGATAVD